MFRQEIEICAWDSAPVQSDHIHHYSSLQSANPNLVNRNLDAKSNHDSGAMKFRSKKEPKLSKTKIRTKPQYKPKQFHQKMTGQQSTKLVGSGPLSHNKLNPIIAKLPGLTKYNQRQKAEPLESGGDCAILNLYEKLSNKIYGASQKQNKPSDFKQERQNFMSKHQKQKITLKANKSKNLGQSHCFRSIHQTPRATNQQFQFLPQLPLSFNHQQESQYLQNRQKQLTQYLHRKRSHHLPSKTSSQNKVVRYLQQNFENRKRFLVLDFGRDGRAQRVRSVQIKKYNDYC